MQRWNDEGLWYGENNKLVNSYGVARVRCDGCGHYFFVTFSCRARGVCPSCMSKRSLLFGEKVWEIVDTLNHQHVTFTIPMFIRWCFPGLFGKDVFMN